MKIEHIINSKYVKVETEMNDQQGTWYAIVYSYDAQRKLFSKVKLTLVNGLAHELQGIDDNVVIQKLAAKMAGLIGESISGFGISNSVLGDSEVCMTCMRDKMTYLGDVVISVIPCGPVACSRGCQNV